MKEFFKLVGAVILGLLAFTFFIGLEVAVIAGLFWVVCWAFNLSVWSWKAVIGILALVIFFNLFVKTKNDKD